MTESSNPYKTPESEMYGEQTSFNKIKLHDNKVYAKSPAVLPQCCVGCGKRGQGNKNYRRVLFHAPTWSFFVGGIYYFVRKKLILNYSICGRCRKLRRLNKFIAYMLFASFFSLFILEISVSGYIFAGLSLFIFTLAIIMSFLSQFPIAVIGHEDGVFRLKLRAGFRDVIFD